MEMIDREVLKEYIAMHFGDETVITRPRQASLAYTFTWAVYYPGDLIRSTSGQCVLERGQIYKVTKFVEPSIPYEQNGVIFVEGEKYGIDAEYIELVEKKNG